jgi:hypothetical protein
VGFAAFFRKIFTGEGDDPDLEDARARHNIIIEKKRDRLEKDREKEPYDPWVEVDNLRRNFFLGSWASRKFRVVGEDKLKEDLEKLERKRQEKEGKAPKDEEGQP